MDASSFEVFEISQANSSKRKIPPVRKSTAGKRKIQHEWKDFETKALIAAVKERPVLWNAGSYEYKISRRESWHEIVDLLNIDEIDINEARTKWLALRSTFTNKLAKMGEKQSGKDILDSQAVTWKYFNRMLFLDVKKIHQSTESVSNIVPEQTIKDRSISEELGDTPLLLPAAVKMGQRNKRRCVQEICQTSSAASNLNLSSVLTNAVDALQPDPNSTLCGHLLQEQKIKDRSISEELENTPLLLPPAVKVGQINKRRCVQGIIQTPSAASNLNLSSVLTNAVAVLQPDPNSTLCDHLLAELRSLSKAKARNLRRRMLKLLLEFTEEYDDTIDT